MFGKRKKEFELLKKSVEELTKIVKTRELDRLRFRDDEFKKVEKLLENVKIQVSDVRDYIDDNTGITHVRIKYKIPDIDLVIDENGDNYSNETFYAINYLRLISLDDINKLKKTLDKVKMNH